MGFDLSGLRARSEKGEYFRNNVWWWRPLADYVIDVCALNPKGWHFNDGHEISAKTAEQIADTLDVLISTGAVKRYEKAYTKRLNSLPDEICDLCHGTGKRTDMEVANGCNGCRGTGKTRPGATNYPFNEQNVKEFRDFVRDSGGFAIY